MSYRANEVFLSIQGEGMRAGTANVFVRFSGCNLECTTEPGPKSPGGFDCDTEYVSGRMFELDELLAHMLDIGGNCGWCVLTGGEPGLQVDSALIDALREAGWKIAIETNGTMELPNGIDWITLSPKVAEHAVRQLKADEIKYVRGHGQGIPRPRAEAQHYLVSPAFAGQQIDERALQWCVALVKENPTWRLSLQTHKWLGIR